MCDGCNKDDIIIKACFFCRKVWCDFRVLCTLVRFHLKTHTFWCIEAFCPHQVAEHFQRNCIIVEMLLKVDPNETAYISSSRKRYKNGSVHTKSWVFSVSPKTKSNENALRCGHSLSNYLVHKGKCAILVSHITQVLQGTNITSHGVHSLKSHNLGRARGRLLQELLQVLGVIVAEDEPLGTTVTDPLNHWSMVPCIWIDLTAWWNNNIQVTF